MSKKFVSFIAPVYNVNLYLDDFFASFKNLPKDQYEIIVVNDKSPENPKSIISKWSSKVNIKYIENKTNLGLGFSRNVALANVSKKSSHFMIIDSDDRLSPKAWGQILKAKSDYVYVSKKYIKFDKNKVAEKQTWKNNAFVGSGVLSAWGNLVPISKSNIIFTSRTFEDFRWMAEITKDNKFIYFDDVTVEYRNRASSIMNTPYNSKKRAMSMVDQANELIKASNENLINNSKFFKRELRNLYIIYKYASAKNRHGTKFNTSYFSTPELLLLNFAIWPQKILRVWWWYELFRKSNSFK